MKLRQFDRRRLYALSFGLQLLKPLLSNLKNGAVLDTMTRRWIRNDNAAFAWVVGAVASVDQKPRSAAHVARVGIQLVARGHALEDYFGTDGVAARWC